jgi:hypothetical protein
MKVKNGRSEMRQAKRRKTYTMRALKEEFLSNWNF